MLKEETCKNLGHKCVLNYRTSILHSTVQYYRRKTALAKKRKDASKTIVDNKKIVIYKLITICKIHSKKDKTAELGFIYVKY